MCAADAAYLIDVTPRSEAVQPGVLAVRGAVAALPHGAWLLAVSGGRDSMVLLDAFASAGRRDVRAVAAFDHGSGPTSRVAAELVERVAGRQGMSFVSARMEAAPEARATEAAWREARWRFLGDWARELGATVVTAHSLDDQLETVALRILRGAGARGLAGMASASAGPPAIARPLLGVTRAAIDEYARDAALEYIDDPSNIDRSHARNRMRLDLLPALERAQPGFRRWLGTLAGRAGEWREGVESYALGLERAGDVTVGDRSVVIRSAPLASLGEGEWRVLWPVLAARAGLAMDRRGVVRASEWAARTAGDDAARGTIQLAGGAELERLRGAFALRRTAR
jgi:tRNA(Ile)-lysidine synthase